MEAILDGLAAVRRVGTELARQCGDGISRDAIVGLAGPLAGFEVRIYSGDPPVAVAVPTQSAIIEELTTRERDVAGLVRQGCSNAEIAVRLLISEATVKDHVHNILTKTGLKSRAGIAGAWNA